MNLQKGKEIIRQKIPNLTKSPGVYKMLSEKNEILYVGKARNIPNRLKSYVAEAAVESKAEVKVWRNKKVKKFTVKLGEREKFDETAKSEEKKDENVEVNELEMDDIGIRLKGLNSKTRTQIEAKGKLLTI